MKISKYTFFFLHQDNYYVYNSLSNALLCIDEESYNLLNKYREYKTEIDETDIDAELYPVLIDKRIIVEDDRDEFLLYRSIVENNRQANNFMHLTVARGVDVRKDFAPYLLNDNVSIWVNSSLSYDIFPATIHDHYAKFLPLECIEARGNSLQEGFKAKEERVY